MKDSSLDTVALRVTYSQPYAQGVALIMTMLYNHNGDLIRVIDLDGNTIFQAEGFSVKREGSLSTVDEGGF